ncbi:glycoside hydrolase family 13 protein [Balneola sp. MJW-20]|uniref:glycoside hydrolase family 13 protein n=1 Tax=Gracilimonas aurantiaca TaxID=3234185 RepID=UPI003464EC1A
MKLILKILLILALLSVISCSEKEKKREYIAPEWAKGITWYQIFPERFNNGDRDNDPDRVRARGPEGWQISSWTGDWYDRAAWELNDSDDFYGTVFERRYGGDLQGVINKLDYLKELGINAIYFNPVFDAQSLHKYDGSYFHHIDRNFGPNPEGDVDQFNNEDPSDPETWQWTSADSLFLKLIEQAHARDIKVVIDGVFNHSGTEFWAFEDLIKNQQNSAFKDWYIVHSFDDPATKDSSEFDYEGWWGFKGLPVFREEDGNLVAPVKEYVFAVTRRWMDPNGDGDTSDGIDGWRLDVAEEVGLEFWKEWHALVYDLNPQAVTVAEIWTDKAKEYISGEMFTSVMNYRFAYAAKDFLIDDRISTVEFVNRLEQIREEYPDGSEHILQNLMDSHDTARLASVIVNPGLEYDRNGGLRDNADFDVRKPNDEERMIQRLVALFQFTWEGAPMIYYGTEAGMWGADDPDDRKPMVWPENEYETEDSHPLGASRPSDDNNFDEDLFGYYQSLISIREENEVLKTGKGRFLYQDPESKMVAFIREKEGEDPILVVLNRSADQGTLRIPLAEIGMEINTIAELNSSTGSQNVMSMSLASVAGDEIVIQIPAVSGSVYILSP